MRCSLLCWQQSCPVLCMLKAAQGVGSCWHACLHSSAETCYSRLGVSQSRCLPAAALQQRQAEGHSPAPQMQQQQQDRADLLQQLAAYQQDCECLSRNA